jgi:two-component system OmpR family sensor kinase
VRKRAPLPLAVRLPAMTATVVAAALLVVVGLTVQVARHHLSGTLDHQLRASADSFGAGPGRRITAPDQLAGEAARWLSTTPFDSGEVVAVRTAEGQVLTGPGRLDARTLPRATELLAAHESRWWNLGKGRGAVRALTVPLTLDGRQIGTLVVAGSRAPVEAALRGLLSPLGWTGAVGLALAALLAFAAVRRTLGPLLRMSRQVDAIHATGDLSRRVGTQGPRDEVGRLGEGFNRLLTRVQEAFDSQRRFVSDASHELRTPLTVARGQIELALADPATGPASGALTAAVVELDRMGRIVEDLLLLARLDEGLRLARVPVEVELVAEEALLRGLRLAHRSMRVDAEPGLCARADPDRLLQVLSNLVVNAVLHAGAGATVTLRSRRDGSHVVIEVADDGCGIPADALPHVFDRFYRTRTDAGGAGLGLAIVQSLTRAMGGSVAVTAVRGEGTTFTVRLRAAVATADPAPVAV